MDITQPVPLGTSQSITRTLRTKCNICYVCKKPPETR